LQSSWIKLIILDCFQNEKSRTGSIGPVDQAVARTPEKCARVAPMVFFSPCLHQKEEGGAGILTMASDGGGATWFGQAAGRRQRRPLALDGDELEVRKRRNDHRFGCGGGSGCSWAALIGRGW
jgi:hypothetical protein